MDLLARISSLRAEIEHAVAQIRTGDELEAFRLAHLVRKGSIQALVESLRSVPPAEKPAVGKELNVLKRYAEGEYERLTAELAAAPALPSLVDVTLPGRALAVGSVHPITRTIEEIVRIFSSLGFTRETGPEIEDDFHNFGALNFPPDHPARDMQDTFHVEDAAGNFVLRTHTTPVQVRVLERSAPPIRIIVPGRVYRNEAVSARSYCMFHQVDGFVIDEGITFSELQGTLISFARQFFTPDVKARFRASYFPFTEPSAEMDITCYVCAGKGCRLCKHTGWLEILGCGMIHPNVLRTAGIDTERYTGYAFGIGIERTLMLRYGIDDIRVLFENDLRVLRQF
jgi:phenylalanyl-tRNA synthetase alpha chain